MPEQVSDSADVIGNTDARGWLERHPEVASRAVTDLDS